MEDHLVLLEHNLRMFYRKALYGGSLNTKMYFKDDIFLTGVRLRILIFKKLGTLKVKACVMLYVRSKAKANVA